ncbi:hypothetical protein NECID01_0189 [Nematocida sp. AWRm77]|nr:hypothetical protein NECID01_0189 [Nematocida sp. AWRm77]
MFALCIGVLLAVVSSYVGLILLRAKDLIKTVRNKKQTEKAKIKEADRVVLQGTVDTFVFLLFVFLVRYAPYLSGVYQKNKDVAGLVPFFAAAYLERAGRVDYFGHALEEWLFWTVASFLIFHLSSPGFIFSLGVWCCARAAQYIFQSRKKSLGMLGEEVLCLLSFCGGRVVLGMPQHAFLRTFFLVPHSEDMQDTAPIYLAVLLQQTHHAKALCHR